MNDQELRRYRQTYNPGCYGAALLRGLGHRCPVCGEEIAEGHGESGTVLFIQDLEERGLTIGYAHRLRGEHNDRDEAD